MEEWCDSRLANYRNGGNGILFSFSNRTLRLRDGDKEDLTVKKRPKLLHLEKKNFTALKYQRVTNIQYVVVRTAALLKYEAFTTTTMHAVTNSHFSDVCWALCASMYLLEMKGRRGWKKSGPLLLFYTLWKGIT
jgi:hypothetical protein